MTRFLSCLLCLAALLSLAPAADAMNLPVKVINGKEYYYYPVKRGETLLTVASRLGITRDELVHYNPSAADGLRQGTTLYLPVSEYSHIDTPLPEELPGTRAAGSEFTYKVQKGETLFGVCHRFGLKPEDIIALNPTADRGLHPGQLLRIPGNARIPGTDIATTQQTAPATEVAEVAPEETPAAETPVPPVSPVNNEPTVASPVPPVFPVYTETPAETPVSPVYTENPDDNRLRPVEPPMTYVPGPDSVPPATVAVLLPLMLNDENMNKTARSATEFARGFMLGLNSLAGNSMPLDIRVYDSAARPDTVATILSRPELSDVQVVIAPEDIASFSAVADAMNGRNAYVLNLFAVQDSTYLTNNEIVQANIPQDLMYTKAADAMLMRFDGFTPVFLISKGGRSEKLPFTNYLRTVFAENGIQPLEISFEGMLSQRQIEDLDPEQNYVFIPASGSLTEFNKISRAIAAVARDRAGASEIALFGYPDWTTFRGDALESLHELGAVIYSRFYADATSAGVLDFQRTYKDTYGSDLVEQVPSQAIMGYDTARYLIENIRANNGSYDPLWESPFRGLQSSFMFYDSEENDADGFANKALYIISFLPDGHVDVQIN